MSQTTVVFAQNTFGAVMFHVGGKNGICKSETENLAAYLENNLDSAGIGHAMKVIMTGPQMEVYFAVKAWEPATPWDREDVIVARVMDVMNGKIGGAECKQYIDGAQVLLKRVSMLCRQWAEQKGFAIAPDGVPEPDVAPEAPEGPSPS